MSLLKIYDKLIIISGANKIVINNYSDGDYNITLEESSARSPIYSPNMNDFLNSFRQARSAINIQVSHDPLVLDLNGDGVKLISLANSSVFFDLDNDGMKEQVGWISSQDGILALDSNNNGNIDNIVELFGYQNQGERRVSGTEELRSFDSNHNDIIDQDDEIFDQLLIWRDANSNGISEDGEITTLAQNNIRSININNITASNQNIDDNIIISTTTYTTNDGAVKQAANLDLAINQTNSLMGRFQDQNGNMVNNYDLNLQALSLPMSRGYGNIKPLLIAASMDQILFDQLKTLADLNIYKDDLSNIDRQIEQIIYRWAGAEQIVGKRGLFEAKKMAVLEAFIGENFLDLAGNSNVRNWQIEQVEQAWNSLFNEIRIKLLIQGTFKEIFPNSNYDFLSDKINFNNLTKEGLLENLRTSYEHINNPDNKIYFINQIKNLVPSFINEIENIDNNYDIISQLNAIMGDAANTRLNNHNENNNNFGNNFTALNTVNGVIHGTDFDDIINGDDLANVIEAGNGVDSINSYAGDDIINAGKGADNLDGGAGDDIYIYNIGDGGDVIIDDAGVDKIRFGSGISRENIYFTEVNGLFTIRFKNNFNDHISIRGSDFRHIDNIIEFLEFSDGQVINLSDISNITFESEGTENNDFIYSFIASNNSWIFNGKQGNDAIEAGSGDDILNGGTGNDNLYGGDGNDVYIYNSGDGVDTIGDSQGSDIIEFGPGINREDILFYASLDSMVIKFKDKATDQIHIRRDYWSGNYPIETLRFYDGSVLDLQDPDLIFKYNGSMGADSIHTYYDNNHRTIINVYDGNDWVLCGNEEDLINGGKENYIYNLGDGKDYIADQGGVDKIKFGTGIAFNDLRFFRDSEDLIIKLDDNSQITLVNQFKDYSQRIEILEFEDSSSINISNVDSLEISPYDYEDGSHFIYGKDGDDNIVGTDLDELIYTGQGDDVINGGAGGDEINGGNGSDIFCYSSLEDSTSAAPDLIISLRPEDKIKFIDLGFTHIVDDQETNDIWLDNLNNGIIDHDVQALHHYYDRLIRKDIISNYDQSFIIKLKDADFLSSDSFIFENHL